MPQDNSRHEPEWGSVRAGALEELSRALGEAGKAIDTMARKSAGRAGASAEYAGEVIRRVRREEKLRDMTRAARDRVRTEERESRSRAEAHRDVLAALLSDLGRLVRE
jgi:uncharacterized protein YllA (UPF0747 family)